MFFKISTWPVDAISCGTLMTWPRDAIVFLTYFHVAYELIEPAFQKSTLKGKKTVVIGQLSIYC